MWSRPSTVAFSRTSTELWPLRVKAWGRLRGSEVKVGSAQVSGVLAGDVYQPADKTCACTYTCHEEYIWACRIHCTQLTSNNETYNNLYCKFHMVS